MSIPHIKLQVAQGAVRERNLAGWVQNQGIAGSLGLSDGTY
jgi:hypothetical protein